MGFASPIALAHWIMGDGKAKPLGLILCTDSYTIKEVVRLMNVLMIRYRLDCTLIFHPSNENSFFTLFSLYLLY